MSSMFKSTSELKEQRKFSLGTKAPGCLQSSIIHVKRKHGDFTGNLYISRKEDVGEGPFLSMLHSWSYLISSKRKDPKHEHLGAKNLVLNNTYSRSPKTMSQGDLVVLAVSS